MPRWKTSMTPGRVVALAGLTVGAASLYLGAGSEDGSPTLWRDLGDVGRIAVIAGCAVIIALLFRPEARRWIDVTGASLAVVAACSAAAMSGSRLLASVDGSDGRGLGALLLVAGTIVLLAGVSWDLASTIGEEAVPDHEEESVPMVREVRRAG
jgi:hypothetical protein